MLIAKDKRGGHLPSMAQGKKGKDDGAKAVAMDETEEDNDHK